MKKFINETVRYIIISFSCIYLGSEIGFKATLSILCIITCCIINNNSYQQDKTFIKPIKYEKQEDRPKPISSPRKR